MVSLLPLVTLGRTGWFSIVGDAGGAGAADVFGGRSLRISSGGATGRMDRRGGVLGVVGWGAAEWFDEWLVVAASFVDAAGSAFGLFESREFF